VLAGATGRHGDVVDVDAPSRDVGGDELVTKTVAHAERGERG
jgi:hypothetical protein